MIIFLPTPYNLRVSNFLEMLREQKLPHSISGGLYMTINLLNTSSLNITRYVLDQNYSVIDWYNINFEENRINLKLKEVFEPLNLSL